MLYQTVELSFSGKISLCSEKSPHLQFITLSVHFSQAVYTLSTQSPQTFTTAKVHSGLSFLPQMETRWFYGQRPRNLPALIPDNALDSEVDDLSDDDDPFKDPDYCVPKAVVKMSQDALFESFDEEEHSNIQKYKYNISRPKSSSNCYFYFFYNFFIYLFFIPLFCNPFFSTQGQLLSCNAGRYTLFAMISYKTILCSIQAQKNITFLAFPP